MAKEKGLQMRGRNPGRQFEMDALKAQRDFQSYQSEVPTESEAQAANKILGGYNVVVKTKAESLTSGDSVKIFVWAKSRAMAEHKALSFIPQYVLQKADEYVITSFAAGLMSPYTPEGVVPCR